MIVWIVAITLLKQKKNLITKVFTKMWFLKKKCYKILPKQVTTFSKVLGVKTKWLKRSLSILLFLIRRPLIWERCIYYLKFTKSFLIFLTYSLYRTVARLQKRFRSFWIVILKVLCKKGSNDFINKTKNLKDIPKDALLVTVIIITTYVIVTFILLNQGSFNILDWTFIKWLKHFLIYLNCLYDISMNYIFAFYCN